MNNILKLCIKSSLGMSNMICFASVLKPHQQDAIPYVKRKVSKDAKLTTFDVPEDDLIHDLKITFVFYKTGSNLNQGRVRETFVHMN
jgi:hypothetical protein